MKKLMFHSEYDENMKGDLVYYGDESKEIFSDYEQHKPQGIIIGGDNSSDYPFSVRNVNGNVQSWRYIAYDCN